MQLRHGTKAYTELPHYIKSAGLVPLAHTSSASTEEFTHNTSRVVYQGRTNSRLYHIYREIHNFESDLYLQVIQNEPQENLWFKIERENPAYFDAVGESCQAALSPFRWTLLMKYFKEAKQNVDQ